MKRLEMLQTKIASAIIAIAFIVHPVFPVTSSESVNQFNKFMSPSRGVDLYWGNAIYK